MLLVSWNVAGRVTRLGEQAERLLALDADVVCLQELTRSTLAPWQQLLADAGYAGICSVQLASAAERSRALTVLTAARCELRRARVAALPWPERVLAVRAPSGAELLNVHSPISTKPGLAKVRTHEAVHAHLAATVSAAGPAASRILCGDLNTPRKEHPDGSVWTFARDRNGRLRPDRGERWDRAELALIRGLEPCGFRDAFRLLHGYTVRELSWQWPRWPGGYRLDHLIVSAEVVLGECRYEHSWREAGLSDHSALIARIDAPDLAGLRSGGDGAVGD